ncbi:MAG: glycosyltransferase family 1 protein [Gloeocapsa sp. DLM2.Bin57]|nr:MAG: glycosyltransferase family 1 protein [Gloeocapsa sp. DLM2.Bin57]
MKTKILHLITRLAVGGAQDNTFISVEKGDRSRFMIHLASHPEGIWRDRANQVADVFHPIPHLVNPVNPVTDLQALLEIISLLRRENFALIHTHSSKAGILGRIAARIVGVPVIIHTIHGFSFHDFMPFWQRQLYINLEKMMKSYSDFIITVSELNRQQGVELGILDLERSQTVYSGIDFSKLDQPVNQEAMRQNLDIPPDYQIIVMVGRLDPQKAPQYLIDAFAQVLLSCPQTILLLVGEGEEQVNLEHQVKTLGIAQKVKFLGFRRDIPSILQTADIFALSSLWEGLGRAMTEAMLLGKPVVVPEIYGIPEIVHHQETGLLFPPKDVNQLAQHLIYLLENPPLAKQLGDNAQKLTRELFDAKIMVKQLEDIYLKLLNE